MALLLQATIAFALCIFSGLSDLISFSVFNLAFAFLLTCLALLVLGKRKHTKKLHGQRILPIIGIIICLYLITMYLLGSTALLIKIIGILLSFLEFLSIYSFHRKQISIISRVYFFLKKRFYYDSFNEQIVSYPISLCISINGIKKYYQKKNNSSLILR